MLRTLAILLLLCAPLLTACQTPAPVAELEAAPGSLRQLDGLGTVTGMDGLYGGHAWLGIPYAKPPVGELRWRAPQAPDPFGNLAALEHSQVCPQFANAFGGVTDVPSGSRTGSEDCLSLDVYAPAWSPAEVPSGADRLPVMFWIHGGGNSIGTNSFYDGSRLASEQQVVVVAVNYRLGALGWMRHPKLHEGQGAIERSGNFGTLDLIHALGWVGEHIATFGGDPGNVTIFGESAGGHNVFTLLASPLAKGLFHRAIVQSGGTWEDSIAEAENFVDDPEPGSPQSSSEVLLQLLQRDGRADSREQAKTMLAEMSGSETAAYLRGKSVDELFSLYSDSGIGMYDSPRVFADGSVLPAEGIAQVLDDPARYNAVPIMLGTNRDEQKLFSFFDPRYVTRYFEILPVMKDEHAFYRDSDLQSRAWKLSGVDHPAGQLVENQPAQVFAYRWDWDEEPKILWADLGRLIGASHGFEIPFVFGHFDLGPTGNLTFVEENAAGREELSAAMRSYWAAFAYAGDPGRGRDGDLPLWSAWDPAGERYVILDTRQGGGIRMSRDVETAEAIAAEILADTSYRDEPERCTGLAMLANETHGFFGRDGFAAAGNGRCASYDMEALLRARWEQ